MQHDPHDSNQCFSVLLFIWMREERGVRHFSYVMLEVCGLVPVSRSDLLDVTNMNG